MIEGEKRVGDMKYGYFEGEDGSTHYFPSEDAALRAAAMKGAARSGAEQGNERIATRRRMMGRPKSGKSP